jgi:hypothetical protein
MENYAGILSQDGNGSQVPVEALATLVKSEICYLWVVECCPLCSYRHSHAGGYLFDDPRDFLGLRTTFCTGEARTYRLVERATP